MTVHPSKGTPLPDQVSDLLGSLRLAAERSSSEEDLRVEVEIALRRALPELPSPKYEASLKASTFSGRTDALP